MSDRSRSERRARQLPLALDHRPAQTRDDLVVTAANREAVALVDRWPDWPSYLAVLVGPPGSGKSHLGAVWRERSDAIELRAGAFELPQVDDSGRLPAVLIDDADAPGLDEKALFHLLNAARGAGSSVLLTARRGSANWGVRLPDLASRLNAAALAEIGAPDDALLQGVIAKLFADRQVEVEPQVAQFVVRRMERSLTAAMRLVAALDRAALERKSRITRALAAEVLEEPPFEPQVPES
ncbi:MAG TPA: hypothetical protein VGN97_05900 [Mesorhizobium sp.]|nr:hypothetical protein [Mesorhizobium sp.]